MYRTKFESSRLDTEEIPDPMSGRTLTSPRTLGFIEDKENGLKLETLIDKTKGKERHINIPFLTPLKVLSTRTTPFVAPPTVPLRQTHQHQHKSHANPNYQGASVDTFQNPTENQDEAPQSGFYELQYDSNGNALAHVISKTNISQYSFSFQPSTENFETDSAASASSHLSENNFKSRALLKPASPRSPCLSSKDSFCVSAAVSSLANTTPPFTPVSSHNHNFDLNQMPSSPGNDNSFMMCGEGFTNQDQNHQHGMQNIDMDMDSQFCPGKPKPLLERKRNSNANGEGNEQSDRSPGRKQEEDGMTKDCSERPEKLDINHNSKSLKNIQSGGGPNFSKVGESGESTRKLTSFPNVNSLLENCECFMNWTLGPGTLTEEKLKGLVTLTENKYIFPNESFDFHETVRWNSFEQNSHLAALAFFYIELGRLKEARGCVVRARDFLDTCVGAGTKANVRSLPQAFASSFDYLWDYICLYGSVKEWHVSGIMDVFPEMNLFALVLSFWDLPGNIQAGVYCAKSYFYRLLGQVEMQIEALKKAVTLEPHYFEWFLCLQEGLRMQRQKYKEFHVTHPWDAELQAVWTASLLAPSNPRCVLAAICLLSEIAKAQFGSSKWTVVKYGDRNFHGLMDLKAFIKELAEIVMKLAPRSARMNLQLAQIFNHGLPYGHRDFRFGKECLDRVLKFHPNSSKANLQMAEYYISVDTNYRRAEMYYGQALAANEKSFGALVGIIQIMLRTAEHRKTDLFALIDRQLTKPLWDAKQLGTLFYYKALAHIVNEQPKLAIESFLTAVHLHEKSLLFQDLPSQHRRFGWPGWPSTSKLTFSQIKSELLREKLRSEPEKKKLLHSIMTILGEAEAKETRCNRVRKSWKR